jgi:hypothetical protein
MHPKVHAVWQQPGSCDALREDDGGDDEPGRMSRDAAGRP